MYTYTMFDLLGGRLAARAEHPAVVLGDAQVTYGQLASRAEALAGWLYQQGVRRGDRVCIHLNKSVEEVVAAFAAARLGAIVVNVFHQSTVEQLQYVIEDCGARTMFTGARRAGELIESGIMADLDRVVVVGRPPEHKHMFGWSQLPSDLPPPTDGPVEMDVAALIYTSGSTGKPKGVMHTHRNVVQFARIVSDYLGNTADDRLMSLLPMSFGYGLSQYVTMFYVGGTVVLQPVALPAEIVKTINRHGVTGLAGVAPAWIQITEYLQQEPTALPTLRYVTNAGGKLPARTLDELPQALPGVNISLMYGSTEVFRTTWLPPQYYQQKKGSMGVPIPNVEVFVLDTENDRLCGPGEEGELVHRGSLVSPGYWNKPQASAEKFKPCPALAHRIGDEKVLYTGDLVRMDEDGFFWFISRKDTLIKSSGFRISPTEIEDIVSKSGMVSHVIAFGAEDDRLGQAVELAVTSTNGRPVDVDALLAYCRRHMPHYMMPRRVHAWDGDLPRTGSGKLDRPTIIHACTVV